MVKRALQILLAGGGFVGAAYFAFTLANKPTYNLRQLISSNVQIEPLTSEGVKKDWRDERWDPDKNKVIKAKCLSPSGGLIKIQADNVVCASAPKPKKPKSPPMKEGCKTKRGNTKFKTNAMTVKCSDPADKKS